MTKRDLGNNHSLRFNGFAPDRSIEANATRYENVPDIERYGATVTHLNSRGETCWGGIVFDTPEVQALRAVTGDHSAVWQVQSWEPLTVKPSLLCDCGDHGFIREGGWVPV